MSDQEGVAGAIFEEADGVAELIGLLGLEPDVIPEVVQDDGSLILGVGDRALSIEAQPAVNGVVIMAFIARTNGLDMQHVLHDLMVLNARPHDTGGLIFGLLGDDVLVGTLTVPQPFATPRTLADAVAAVIESTDVWRTVIEAAFDASESDAGGAEEGHGGEPLAPGSHDRFV